MSENTGAAKIPTPALTREDWLQRAVAEVLAVYGQLGYTTDRKIHVSVGFGSGGGKYESGHVLGVCWHSSNSADGGNQIFVSPTVGDTAEVVAILLHEVAHALDDNTHGHKGPFVEMASKVGFMKPFTTLNPDASLTAMAMTIAAALGEYPHAVLSPVAVPVPSPTGDDGGVITIPGKPHSGPTPQENRHKAVTCPVHGGTVRLSRARFEQGAPLCGIVDVTDEGTARCEEAMIWK